MKYRVVMKVSYCEMDFDFDNPEEAVKFMTVALFNLTPREDGKNAKIFIEKVDVEAEKQAEAEEEKEDE